MGEVGVGDGVAEGVAIVIHSIRRLAHDASDVEGLLAFVVVAVVGEEVALFVELEGVGEADVLEGFVTMGRPFRARILCLT